MLTGTMHWLMARDVSCWRGGGGGEGGGGSGVGPHCSQPAACHLACAQLTRLPRRDLSPPPSPGRSPSRDPDAVDDAPANAAPQPQAHAQAQAHGLAAAQAHADVGNVDADAGADLRLEAVHQVLQPAPVRRPPVVVRPTAPLGSSLASITSTYGRDKVKDIVCNAYLVWVRNGNVRAVGHTGGISRYEAVHTQTLGACGEGGGMGPPPT